MRKALNENPMVQIAVLAVGVLVLGIVLMTSMGGGGGDEAVPEADSGATASVDAATTQSSAAADTPGTEVTPSVEPTPSREAASPGEAATPGQSATGASPDERANGMLPSKGLPRDLLVAYANGDAIALLVTNPKSLSGPRMKAATRSLERRDDVTTFIVNSKDIADYSRITSGVSLSRVPALIVVRPRELTDDVPTASVSYGFRGKDSVKQAVDDALYDGRQRASYP